MVVLVDGAADSAQGVVAVGEQIGQGELGHAGGTGRLDDTNIGDVMRGHGVVLQLEVLHVIHGVVGLQDTISHGALARLFLGDLLGELSGIGDDLLAVYKIDTGVIEFQHDSSPFCAFAARGSTPHVFLEGGILQPGKIVPNLSVAII